MGSEKASRLYAGVERGRRAEGMMSVAFTDVAGVGRGSSFTNRDFKVKINVIWGG